MPHHTSAGRTCSALLGAAALLVAFLAIPAAAQTVPAPGPVTLYAHALSGPADPVFSTVTDSWMSFNEEEPDDAQYASQQTHNVGGMTMQWVFPLRPALTQEVGIDASQDVTFRVCLGTGVSGGYVDSLSVSLTAGSTTIAAPAAMAVGPVALGYTVHEFAAAPEVSSIPAGDLVWTITAEAVHTNLVVQMPPECDTSLTLALTSAPDQAGVPGTDDLVPDMPEVVEVTGPVFEQTITVQDGGPADLSAFNWTAPALTDPRLTVDASVDAGQWMLGVGYWPYDSEDYEGEYFMEATSTQRVEEVLEGEFAADVWGIFLGLSDFSGTITIRIAPGAAEAPPATVAPPAATAAPPAAGNGSEPVSEAESEESPGVWLPALAVGLLAAVVAARRRR